MVRHHHHRRNGVNTVALASNFASSVQFVIQIALTFSNKKLLKGMGLLIPIAFFARFEPHYAPFMQGRMTKEQVAAVCAKATSLMKNNIAWKISIAPLCVLGIFTLLVVTNTVPYYYILGVTIMLILFSLIGSARSVETAGITRIQRYFNETLKNEYPLVHWSCSRDHGVTSLTCQHRDPATGVIGANVGQQTVIKLIVLPDGQVTDGAPLISGVFGTQTAMMQGMMNQQTAMMQAMMQQQAGQVHVLMVLRCASKGQELEQNGVSLYFFSLAESGGAARSAHAIRHDHANWRNAT